MVRVYPNAEFEADFPNDQVDEDGRVAIFPGRNVSEAIAELVRGAGVKADEPEHQHEHGWAFVAKYESRSIWVEICTFEDQQFHMYAKYGGLLGFLPSTKRAHREFLTLLSRVLNGDPRFRNVVWFSNRDDRHDFGSPVPIEEG